MTHPSPPPKVQLGLTRRPEGGPVLSVSDWIALGLTGVWLLLCLLFFLLSPGDGDGGGARVPAAVVVLAVLLPVGLIWVAAWASRATRVMERESQRLQAALDAMRQAYIAANQSQGSAQRRDLDRRVDELLRLVKRLEGQVATLGAPAAGAPLPAEAPAPRRAEIEPADTGEDAAQPTLALGTPAEVLAEPISSEDFIRALNFPEDESDREGFQSLRRALRDRSTAPLIRSAQDVLTLMAEDGIYMDDLAPDRAKPQVWREFAAGVRGRAIAGLGGVRDRTSLALTAGRMRQDPVFRDVAHHFLRRFDQTFAQFEKAATDAEIVALAETRTARAFMLVGRVSGTFD